MKIIEFRDTCTIERMTGEKDSWDNPVFSTVYSGECLYQEAGTGYSRSLITRNPTVFIPDTDNLVMINDAVTIVTEKGREIKSVVEIVRDVNLPWLANIKCTRIELKQAHGN